MTAANTPGGGLARPDDCNSAPAQIYDEPNQLHHCPEVMNPPQSAAEGCEAGNLIMGDVMGMGHVHRAAKDRPSDAVPPPFADEQQLEQAIKAASDRMCAAPERADKLRHWHELAKLIDQRTPARVRFMERMRGL